MRILQVTLVAGVLPFGLLSFGLPSGTAAAQRSPLLSTTGHFTSGNGPACHAQSLLTTQAQWTGLSATAFSAPIAQATRFGTTTPIVAIAAQSSAKRTWQLEASGAVGHAESDCLEFSGQTRALAGLSRSLGHGAIALSYGYRSLSSLDPSRDRQGLGVAIWQRLRRVGISFDIRAHDHSSSYSREVAIPIIVPDSSPIGGNRITVDTTYRSVTSQVIQRAVDLRTAVQFQIGRVRLDLSGGSSTSRRALPGASVGGDTMRTHSRYHQLWTRANAHVPLTGGLTVTAGVAALPAQPALNSSVRGIYSLGVSFARWPSRSDDRTHTSNSTASLETVRDDATRVRFRVRVPRATEVRVSGEPTRWNPVSMQRTSDDWWETTLTVSPGLYRMNISVDGAAWRPPPDVPTARDEFGGQVGLVTVR